MKEILKKWNKQKDGWKFFGLIFLVSIVTILLLPPKNAPARVIFQIAVFLMVPLSMSMLRGKTKKEVGWQFKNLRINLLYGIGLAVLIVVPLLVYAIYIDTESFRALYTPLQSNTICIGALIFYLIPQFFALEFFYRGFALFQLKKYFGANKAILLQSIPYTIIHLWKPGFELAISFFAGLIFGYFAIKTKSFLVAFIAHVIIAATFMLVFRCWLV